VEFRVRSYVLPVILTILLILILIVCVFINVPDPPAPEDTTYRPALEPVTLASITQVSAAPYTSTPTGTPTTLRLTATGTPSPIPIPTPTPTVPSFKVYIPLIMNSFPTRLPSVEVLVNGLRIREGPGLHFPVLYAVHKGELLVAQSKNMDFENDPWFLIKVRSDNTEEWISGDTRYVRYYNVERLSFRKAR